MRIFFLILFVPVLFIACKGEKELSDAEKIEASVRSYLFLGDSITVSTTVLDTIHVEELNGMLSTTEENIGLIGQDIDTLASMIDELAYQIKADEEASLDVSQKKILFLEYRLKYEQLNAQYKQFTQTNRVLYHLKRSVWADFAGFEVSVNYNVKGKPVETTVLMDAEFRVVD